MKQYPAKNIINVVLAGHSGSGKTSLAEAMLYLAGVTDRIGKIVDGNTVCDFDPEEVKRTCSVSAAVAPLEWKGNKINVIDAPGQFDYAGGAREAYRAAECAIAVVSARSGVSVGAEKAIKMATERNMSKMIFINKLDKEGVSFQKTLESLREVFGQGVCPVVVYTNGVYVNMIENKAYKMNGTKMAACDVPAFDEYEDYMTEISEAVAEADEELMMKYFDGEEFTHDEIVAGLKKGAFEGSVIPVFCGIASDAAGAELLLDGITWLAPNALEARPQTAKDEDGNKVEINVDESAPTAAVVFKTVADPFVGKLSYFKVYAGKISSDTPVVNMRTGANEKIGKTLLIRGKKQEDVPFIGAGDIGAVPKLANTLTGDTLASPARKVTLAGVKYPGTSLSMAIMPKAKGEEEKVAQGLQKLNEEDPSFTFGTNTETKQMVLSGQGDQHIDVIVSKLKAKYNVDTNIETPRVAYRETIRKTVSVQGRHKKQSGGHGQFGDIWVRFEPCDAPGLEFAEEVVGGSVPKNFFPAVEKGLNESMQKGVLAGYPVVGVRAVLYDGSYHPVDSSEMAFKTAANIAFKNGIPQASPTLLEPIGTLKAYVPNDNMGDVMGEVTKRRGRVLGMNPADNNLQELCAEVPMAEMGDFSTFIRQTAQGRGYFTLEFERYEDAPPMVAQKVIEEAKARAEDE